MLYSRTPPWPCDLPKDLYRSCCTQLTPERSLVRSQYRPRSRGVSCARGVRGLARSLSVPGGATPRPRPAGLRPPDPLAGSACIRLAGSACIRAGWLAPSLYLGVQPPDPPHRFRLYPCQPRAVSSPDEVSHYTARPRSVSIPLGHISPVNLPSTFCLLSFTRRTLR